MKPNTNQSLHIANKFAECCALKNPGRLYQRMMKASRHNLRNSLQSIFRKPSTILSIVDSHPEVLQFLREFQPELDQIINTTPKSSTWLSKDPVPRGYWEDMRNQRNFFEWIAIQRDFRTHQDWYQLTNKDVLSLGGRGLLKKYNGSMIQALQTIYPEKDWQSFLFDKVPQGYWDDMGNQQNFLEWLAIQRGFKTHQDWYQLTTKDVVAFGGAGLLNKYNNSLTKALQTIYPEKNWQPFLFQQVPVGYWNDRSNIMQYMNWLAEQLGIQTMDDWNSTALWEVVDRRGSTLIKKKFGSVFKLLKYCYPDYPWNQSKLRLSGNLSTQLHLLKIIRDLFKHHNVDVFHDYTHLKMLFSDTNRPMQLDIFIPQLNLAFEYQGEQHYGFHYLYGHGQEQQKRDAEKKAKCTELGITLIEVPYWWDKTSASLLATIHEIRPDVISTDQVPQGAVPIPIKKEKIARKGTRSFSSVFMLPTHWDPSIQPTGWWMSEMYHGVRALWNAEKKIFQLRNGITIQPPAMFAESLSHLEITQLDGVLWLGYGKQNDLAQRLQENNQDENLWRDIQYLVFDIPNSPYDSDERIAILKSLNTRKDCPVKVIDQIMCEGEEHLKKTLHEIEMKGGEGIILKLPKSPYKEGVSTSMMKVEIPQGRARIKSINTTNATCELPSGIVFDIPLTPAQSETLQKENSAIVSFGHADPGWNGFTAPINPSLLAIRRDLSWENVLEESTPYFLAEVKPKAKPKCVGCKQSINKTQYCVHLQSLYTPILRKPHAALYQFCSKAECINKASAMTWFSSGKLIPKMEAVYVPSTLQLSEEKLKACEGLNLLSARPL